jgi:uncharacterized membrane protein
MTAAGYSAFGVAHAAAGLIGLGSGLAVFLGRKGTARHVRIGWVYVAAMVWVDGSALLIRHLTGRFNLFHALAVVSLAMVLGGVAQVVLRRRIRRWLWRHYQYMSWSYVGLLAATANELCVRVPALKAMTSRSRGWLPVAASAVIVGTSALVIACSQRRVLLPLDDVQTGGISRRRLRVSVPP